MFTQKSFYSAIVKGFCIHLLGLFCLSCCLNLLSPINLLLDLLSTIESGVLKSTFNIVECRYNFVWPPVSSQNLWQDLETSIGEGPEKQSCRIMNFIL